MHGLSRIPHDSVRRGMLERNVRRGMLGGPGGRVLLASASFGNASAHGSAEHAPMHETGDKSSETVRWGMLGAGWRKATPDEGYLLALE